MAIYILSILLSFVSGDAFRNLADHRFETLQPERVHEGEIIFVKTHDLPDFFQMAHPLILHPYILISHITDESAPGVFAPYLDDPKLLFWHAMNYDGTPHPKIGPLPIGIAPADLPWGNTAVIEKVKERRHFKKHLLFLNFTIQTFSQERWEVFRQFAFAPYCFRTGKKPFEAYLEDMAESKFVLAPRGAGLDTYRLWEAIAIGSIPIVKTSSLDPLYADLPVLIVQDWNEVNEEFLERKYEEISERNWNLEKLHFEYWQKKFDR